MQYRRLIVRRNPYRRDKSLSLGLHEADNPGTLILLSLKRGTFLILHYYTQCTSYMPNFTQNLILLEAFSNHTNTIVMRKETLKKNYECP